MRYFFYLMVFCGVVVLVFIGYTVYLPEYVKTSSTLEFEEKVQLRQSALTYLESKPMVNGNSLSWEEYFLNRNIPSEYQFHYQWFEEQEPKYSKLNDNYALTWVGAPGCNQFSETEAGSASSSGIEWQDAEGNECAIIWTVDVVIDHGFEPQRMDVIYVTN